MILALVVYWIIAGFVTLSLPRGNMNAAENLVASFVWGGIIIPARILMKVIR